MTDYNSIYKVEQLPIFQNQMFDTAQKARACVKGDIELVQDLKTGLIFNQAFQPDLMEYSADYQNEQAISSAFKEHLNNVTKIIQTHFEGEDLLEVGCGKGRFLELLQSRGFNIIGTDPTYEGNNSSVIRQYFDSNLKLQADSIILRHVLEHVKNPIDFCSKIRDANRGGKIYIEVPCFEWILKNHAWFDIYYEHVNYFRLSDFQRMFGKIYESGHIFGGQYIYLIADLDSLRTPVYEGEEWVSMPDFFLHTVKHYAHIIKNSTDAPCVIWGGASKGVIFSLFMSQIGDRKSVV